MEKEDIYSKGTVLLVRDGNRIRKAIVHCAVKNPDFSYVTVHFMDVYPSSNNYEYVHRCRIIGVVSNENMDNSYSSGHNNREAN